MERVAVVTGAGNGIGREHALAFARAGYRVVVNDVGGDRSGHGSDAGAAQLVVDEIAAAGGEAVAGTDDIATMDGAAATVELALQRFGRLDAVVNNAGILRDRMIVSMSEDDWDAVVRVHLKGTFAVTQAAALHWRARSKAGEPVDARIVNTSSASGLIGNPGQSNYGAAKAGIAAFSVIAAQELARYGITVNAIVPNALTRMTRGIGAVEQIVATDEGRRALDPAHMSPLVVWLAGASAAAVTGRVFSIWGTRINLMTGWSDGEHIDSDDLWTQPALERAVPDLLARASAN